MTGVRAKAGWRPASGGLCRLGDPGGGPGGFLANHSLVMASYVSRAKAALLDLSDLLATG